jgi:cytochrome P450
MIPVFAPHGDPKYWPNPEEFHPERSENPRKGDLP